MAASIQGSRSHGIRDRKNERHEISSDHTFAELVSEDGQYTLSMPNTCSYYTTAFSGVMKRNGQTILHFDNENKFCFSYCLINSSFAYLH